MRKFVNLLLAIACFAGVSGLGVGTCGVASADGEYVYIGGTPVGITLNADGLIVTAVGDVRTEQGIVAPLANADIRAGDILTEVDGEDTESLYAFRKHIAEAQGSVELTFERKGEEFAVRATPAKDAATGEGRLGLALKEDVGGVGTLTFVTEEGAYGALGHHVADPETGLSDELADGKLFEVEVDKVTRGEQGRAGGLHAEINRLGQPCGVNEENTPIGIYGMWLAKAPAKRVRVAGKGEARMGHAEVLTTISGDTPKFYDVDIVKVVPQSGSAEKGLVIAVRDKELLEKAGGIVQGMSGSPIVQNGALVGAVTHVFLSDPTRGYGVHARFMLEEAKQVAAEHMKEAA